MELRSLYDYTNVNFSFPRGTTTIGRDDIDDAAKAYLIENFPDEFEETSAEEEAAIATEKARILAIQKANLEEEKPYNPFDSDPMTTKQVEVIEAQEDKMEITSNDTKKATKKK